MFFFIILILSLLFTVLRIIKADLSCLHVRSNLDYPKKVPVKQEPHPCPIGTSSEATTAAKQTGYGLRAWGTVNINILSINNILIVKNA
jgi:hypothetical protein